MITINIEKAKNIWKNKIRTDRIPVLAKLDVDFLRAIENQDIELQNLIVRKKQYLRDAPQDPRFDTITVVEELFNIDPIKEVENLP